MGRRGLCHSLGLVVSGEPVDEGSVETLVIKLPESVDEEGTSPGWVDGVDEGPGGRLVVAVGGVALVFSLVVSVDELVVVVDGGTTPGDVVFGSAVSVSVWPWLLLITQPARPTRICMHTLPCAQHCPLLQSMGATAGQTDWSWRFSSARCAVQRSGAMMARFPQTRRTRGKLGLPFPLLSWFFSSRRNRQCARTESNSPLGRVFYEAIVDVTLVLGCDSCGKIKESYEEYEPLLAYTRGCLL